MGVWQAQNALPKLKRSQLSSTGHENYQYSISAMEQEKCVPSKPFLRWYNNKGVVPALQAIQKMVDFHHIKRIDVLKLGYTLPNLYKFRLPNTTTTMFYTFTESENDLLEGICENMVMGPCILFARKAAVDENLIRDSKNSCKSLAGIDASRLDLYSMRQAMCSGLFIQDGS